MMLSATGLAMYSENDLLPETIVFFLILAALWAVLWFVAYLLFRWIIGKTADNAWFGAGTSRAAAVISLLGTMVVACWVLSGGYLPGYWQRFQYFVAPDDEGLRYAARAVVMLAMGLLPVLIAGLVRILFTPTSLSSRSLRKVVGQCALLVMAGACCLWILGIIDGLAMAGTVALSIAFAMLTIVLYGASAARPAVAEVTQDVSPDRQRVLRLLEEGRISAHESAELLTALAQSAATESAGSSLSPPRKVMIAGALLTLVGFFLPWFQIDLRAEAERLMGWAPQPTAPMQRMFVNGQEVQVGPVTRSEGAGVVVRGGDVGNGLGWIALALPFAVVVLPHMYPKLPAGNRNALTLLALACGSIVTAYLLTSTWRYATYGMAVFGVGYVVLWASALAERRPRLA